MRSYTRLLIGAVSLLSLRGPVSAASVETRALINGREVDGWQAVESTVTAATVEGEPALVFRVPVDWSAGEPSYPIGWPRLQLSVPADQADWRGWEQLRLRVLARSSAGALPFRPLGVTIRSGAERGWWEEEVQRLPAGQWQEATFDLRRLPDPSQVRSVGIFISEDNYADQTVLDLAIARLELVRYTQPTLLELQPLASVAFVDAASLPLQVKVFGLRAGADAAIKVRLAQGRKVVADRQVRAGEGETQLTLALPRGLPSGQYLLSGSVGEQTLSASVTLVTSPWPEVKP
jgi:hypothetical protein